MAQANTQPNDGLIAVHGQRLLYGLNDKPPVESLLVALQHVLAIFVGIITPP